MRIKRFSPLKGSLYGEVVSITRWSECQDGLNYKVVRMSEQQGDVNNEIFSVTS